MYIAAQSRGVGPSMFSLLAQDRSPRRSCSNWRHQILTAGYPGDARMPSECSDSIPCCASFPRQESRGGYL